MEKIDWQPFIKVQEKFKGFHEVCHSLGETGEKPTRYLSCFERETVLVIEPYYNFLIIFVRKQGIFIIAHWLPLDQKNRPLSQH